MARPLDETWRYLSQCNETRYRSAILRREGERKLVILILVPTESALPGPGELGLSPACAKHAQARQGKPRLPAIIDSHTPRVLQARIVLHTCDTRTKLLSVLPALSKCAS